MKITLSLLKSIFSRTLITKNNLNNQEKLYLINLYSKINLSSLPNNTILNKNELTEILGNNFTLIKDVGSENYIIKPCKSKFFTIYEKTEINAFHTKISHPCIPIAMFRKENEDYLLCVHLTTKNKYPDQFFKGIKIGEEIPKWRLIEMKKENTVAFNHLIIENDISKVEKSKDIINYSIIIKRPQSTWGYGENGDGVYWVSDDGIIKQYYPNVLLKCKLNNGEFLQLFFIKYIDIISDQIRDSIIQNIKKQKYLETIELLSKDLNNNNFDDKFKQMVTSREKLKLEDLHFLTCKKPFNLYNIENEEDQKEYFWSLKYKNEKVLLNKEKGIKNKLILNNNSSKKIYNSEKLLQKSNNKIETELFYFNFIIIWIII